MSELSSKPQTGPQLEIAFYASSWDRQSDGRIVYQGLPDLEELNRIGQSLLDAGLVTSFHVGGHGQGGKPELTANTVTVLGELGQDWSDLCAQISKVHPDLQGHISDQADWMTYTQYPTEYSEFQAA